MLDEEDGRRPEDSQAQHSEQDSHLLNPDAVGQREDTPDVNVEAGQLHSIEGIVELRYAPRPPGQTTEPLAKGATADLGDSYSLTVVYMAPRPSRCAPGWRYCAQRAL